MQSRRPSQAKNIDLASIERAKPSTFLVQLSNHQVNEKSVEEQPTGHPAITRGSANDERKLFASNNRKGIGSFTFNHPSGKTLKSFQKLKMSKHVMPLADDIEMEDRIDRLKKELTQKDKLLQQKQEESNKLETKCKEYEQTLKLLEALSTERFEELEGLKKERIGQNEQCESEIEKWLVLNKDEKLEKIQKLNKQIRRDELEIVKLQGDCKLMSEKLNQEVNHRNMVEVQMQEIIEEHELFGFCLLNYEDFYTSFLGIRNSLSRRWKQLSETSDGGVTSLAEWKDIASELKETLDKFMKLKLKTQEINHL